MRPSSGAVSRATLCTAVGAAFVSVGAAQVGPQALPPITDPETYAGFAPPAPIPSPSSRPVAATPQPAPAPEPEVTAPFTRHIIAQGVRGGYAVLAADMNRDGRTDVIALGQREDYLIWYENPYWTPHEIRTPVPLVGMVNMDEADLDGDGIPEIAVTFAFNADPKLSIGNIAILHTSGGDATAPWTMKIVDQVPAPHRVRFADIDGGGKSALVVAPILNAKAQPVSSNEPDHLPTPLYAYRAPEWKRTLISQENIGLIHALRAFDWDGDGRQEVLTGGQSGIYAHSYTKDGSWRRFLVTEGNPAPWPDSGASDLAFGKIGDRPSYATIEPFHGNLVVVYIRDAQGRYRRNVIDNGLKRGHGITMVDIDGDGVSEIVAGGGNSLANTFLYKATDVTGRTWKRMLMDTSMAVQDCVTTDLKGDRRNRDVVCLSGTAPNNVTWYDYNGEEASVPAPAIPESGRNVRVSGSLRHREVNRLPGYRSAAHRFRSFAGTPTGDTRWDDRSR